MIPTVLIALMCLAFTLVGLYKTTRYLDKSDNPFVQHTCFLEGVFFLVLFLIQMAVDTALFVLVLPLI